MSTTAYKVFGGKISEHQIVSETPKGYRTTKGNVIYKERSYSTYSGAVGYNTERTVFDFELAQEIKEAQLLDYFNAAATRVKDIATGYGREADPVAVAIASKVMEQLVEELRNES